MELCNCCEGRTKKPFRFASTLSALLRSPFENFVAYAVLLLPLSFFVALSIFNIEKVGRLMTKPTSKEENIKFKHEIYDIEQDIVSSRL